MKDFQKMQDDTTLAFVRLLGAIETKKRVYKKILETKSTNSLTEFLENLPLFIEGRIHEADLHLNSFEMNRIILGELLVGIKVPKLGGELVKASQPKS